MFTFAPPKLRGAIAQLVEQWTENPCVPGSIPGGTTSQKHKALIKNIIRFFLMASSPHLPHHYFKSPLLVDLVSVQLLLTIL